MVAPDYPGRMRPGTQSDLAAHSDRNSPAIRPERLMLTDSACVPLAAYCPIQMNRLMILAKYITPLALTL